MEALAIFVFLSLALLKRSAELVSRVQAGRADTTAEIAGRGYMLADLPVIEAMSAAAGYNAVLVLALCKRGLEAADQAASAIGC